MLHSQILRRAILTFLVCLLAVGIFALASQAKCSQYQSVNSTGYLSKATKMNGNRCHASVAVPRIVPVFCLLQQPRLVIPREPDNAALPKFVSLDAFRFRPPPSLV